LVGLSTAAPGAGAADSASAATCQSWGAQPPNAEDRGTYLTGVTATSDCNGWAVGYYNGMANQTLIEHWDGTSWTIQPAPGAGNFDGALYGAAAISSTSAWAAGNDASGRLSPEQTLVAHCR